VGVYLSDEYLLPESSYHGPPDGVNPCRGEWCLGHRAADSSPGQCDGTADANFHGTDHGVDHGRPGGCFLGGVLGGAHDHVGQSLRDQQFGFHDVLFPDLQRDYQHER
jgi:hypothetical protein